MSNPSNSLRRLRPDLTPYLFHFTGGSDPARNLGAILREKKLVSNMGYICFTDSPLTMLGKQLQYMNRFPTPMYSQYGIGFLRDVLISDYQCRPVIHGDEKEKTLIEESLHWRYELLDIETHDFTWLREWRILGREFEFSKMNPSGIVVVGPDENVLNKIILDEEIDVEYDYDHSTRIAYPYLQYTFRRTWKGIPLCHATSFKDDNEIQQALVSQEIGEKI